MLLRPQQTQRSDQRDGEYRKDAKLPKRILKNLFALFEQFGKLGVSTMIRLLTAITATIKNGRGS